MYINIILQHPSSHCKSPVGVKKHYFISHSVWFWTHSWDLINTCWLISNFPTCWGNSLLQGQLLTFISRSQLQFLKRYRWCSILSCLCSNHTVEATVSEIGQNCCSDFPNERRQENNSPLKPLPFSYKLH